MTKITQIENEELKTFYKTTDNPFKFVAGSQKSREIPTINPLKFQQRKKIYRQGDILFKQVDLLPSEKTPKKNNVIAEGEATGHAHLLNYGALYEVINSDSLYIKANQNTRITHFL